MRRTTLLGILSLAIIFVWLVSPVATFAQDLTPTDTPADVPTETVTDVVPTDVIPTDATLTDTPTDVVPTETVLPADPTEISPDTAVSLTDVTKVLVDAAVAVSTGDPYIIRGGTTYRFLPIGGCAAFPGDLNCSESSFPIQAAIDFAASGEAIVIEPGTYTESIFIAHDFASLGGDPSLTSPTINGAIYIGMDQSFNLLGVSGLWLDNLVINGNLNIIGSNNIHVDNVVINSNSDTNAVDISDSYATVISDATINKTGPFGDAILIVDSNETMIGETIINQATSNIFGGDYGIEATATDPSSPFYKLTVYNSEIHTNSRVSGGINVTNATGDVEMGGDGTNIGGYGPGEGLLVDLSNPATNSVGINVNNVEGYVFIGNGAKVNISFDRGCGDFPCYANGISLNNIAGSAMVGVNSEVDITGGNGTGISASGIYDSEYGESLLAIGENLDVNLNPYVIVDGGDTYYNGGSGTGIDVSNVEGLTILGSLYDWALSTGIEDQVSWGGNHQTEINVTGGDNPPSVGLSVNGTNNIFASGINSTVPDGIGAVFGNGFSVETSLFTLLSGNTGPLYIANSTFNNNGYEGLIVNNQDGDVTAENIQANHNGQVSGGGFFFPTPGAEFSGITGDLSISNSKFLNNIGSGLMAFADGTVDLKNIESANNGMEGIYIGTGAIDTVNVLDSNIHDNGDDGIHFETWYDFVQQEIVPYNANVFNSLIINNNKNGEADGLDFFGQGTLTICGGVISGNGTEIYVPDPGFLIRYPYYPCSFSEDTGNPGPSPIVVNVEYFPQTSSSGDGFTDPERGLVFNLVSKSDQGDDILKAQAALPAGTVPGGSHGIFTSLLESGLPIGLPDGVSFLGPAFSLSFTLPDGSPITALDGTMQVKFRIPDGLLSSTEEPSSHVNIYYFDGSTWTKLPIIIANGFVFAQVDHPGIFVLTLGPNS
jgi:hypothetical protein